MRIILGFAAAIFLSGCTFSQYAPVAPIYAVSASSPHIAAALSDERRPAADRARDEFRHPAETLAFAQIGPGDRVADLLPGGGYFTRIFAVAVGPEGVAYPTIRPEGMAGQYETPILEVAAQYPNAVMARAPYDSLAYPELLDVVFTAQNYHDMHIAEYNLGDPNGMNRSAFAALKPGGLYIVIDHAAVPSAEMAEALAAHRITENQVRSEVEAAGFIFDGSSDALRNPLDARTLNVFDPAIRGRTDQFMLRFRKPG